jgi:hypothetical protein
MTAQLLSSKVFCGGPGVVQGRGAGEFQMAHSEWVRVGWSTMLPNAGPCA